MVALPACASNIATDYFYSWWIRNFLNTKNEQQVSAHFKGRARESSSGNLFKILGSSYSIYRTTVNNDFGSWRCRYDKAHRLSSGVFQYTDV